MTFHVSPVETVSNERYINAGMMKQYAYKSSGRTTQKVDPATYRHFIRLLAFHHLQRFIEYGFPRLFVVYNLY
jgi:hypothetical protein